MRILFAGTPEPAVPSLEELARRHEVVGVLTRPDAPAGRGRRMEPSAVRRHAAELDIPAWTGRPRGAEFLDWVASSGAQAAAVVAYGEILRPEALDALPLGWVNLHFSVLPQWRGAAPVQRAILAGDDLTGATTFLIEAGLDTGPILGTLTEPIGPRDTSGDLLSRLAQSGAALLADSLDALEAGTARPEPQPAGSYETAAKMTREDAHVRWEHPARDVDRRIRASTPEPGAWTTLARGGDVGAERSSRLTLGPVELVEPPPPEQLAPGQLQPGKHHVLVGTATVPVRLGWVIPQGRKRMAAPDWARGAGLQVEDVLR